MTRLVNKYPVDLTGKEPNNLIVFEKHTLTPPVSTGDLRVLIPNYGGYYTDSLIVRDVSGTRLTPRIDYMASFLYEDATTRSGLEVCGAIIINNQNVSDVVHIDYQVVGGDLAVSTSALEEVLQALADDTRPVDWANIIGRPNTFPAAGHLHALWELYGFEYVVIELERIAQAIIAGHQPALDEVRDYALRLHNEGKDYTDAVEGVLNDHKADIANPHKVTKAQVGLGQVADYPPSTKSESESGTLDNRYMSPKDTKDAIDYQLGNASRQHMADKANPHQVTKAQVGLGLVENYKPANQDEAENGVLTDRYMTPKVTMDAIEKQVGAASRAHRTDTSNPHQVTKAQVGLSEVANYSLASTSEAVSGASNARYMTPYLTKKAIEQQTSQLADRSWVTTQINNRVTEVIGIQSASSSLTLTPYRKYMVSLYGYTTNRGNGGRTLHGPGIKNSSGVWLAKIPNTYINWHDGSAPQSGTMIITAPSDGKITGHLDGGVTYICAIQLN